MINQYTNYPMPLLRKVFSTIARKSKSTAICFYENLAAYLVFKLPVPSPGLCATRLVNPFAKFSVPILHVAKLKEVSDGQSWQRRQLPSTIFYPFVFPFLEILPTSFLKSGTNMFRL